MRWSFRIGKIAGIPIQVHVTFLLLLGWIAISRGLLTGQTQEALGAVTLLLSVFACVVLHELGHALAARRYGIRTRDITLLPIGGLARLERMPEKPSQELVVALAGPAVNVVIALVIGVALHEQPKSFFDLFTAGSLFETLLAINIGMLLFNLVPAFPMDGGRVLRALLAMRLPYERATRIASIVGQGVAVAFGIAGLVTHNYTLLLIAVFVFTSAGEERTIVSARAAVAGVTVREAMHREFRWLGAAEPLSIAVNYTLAGGQTDFPVLDGPHLIGTLRAPALIAAVQRFGATTPVGTVVERRVEACDADDALDNAVARMRGLRVTSLPVLSQGSVVGWLSLDQLGDRLLVRKAIRRLQGDAEA